MAATVVSDLVTKFSFQGSTAPLKDYNSSLGKGIGLLAGMTAAVAGSVFALKAWVAETNQAIDTNIQLSRTTGESVEYIQEMGYVASVNGSNINAFRVSLENLSAVIGEAARGGGPGVEVFKQLGISAKTSAGEVKSAQAVMDEMRSKFQSISSTERIAFAKKLGIDKSLIQLLSLTGDAMDELRAKARALGVVTKEEADAVASYNDAVTTQTAAMDGLKQQIAVGLAPQLQEMSEWITELIVKNREWIVNGIKESIKFLGEFSKMLVRLSPILIGITSVFLAAKLAAFGLAGGLSFLLSPAVLIAAAIFVVVAIIDDLIVAANGGESAIAKMFDSFGIDIGPALKSTIEYLKKFRQDAIDILSDMFLEIDKLLRKLNLGERIYDLLHGNDIKIEVDGKMVPLVPQVEQEWTGSVGRIPQSMMYNTNNQTTSNETNITQEVRIDVKTSDPMQAATQTTSQLENQLNYARMISGRGGR